MAQREERLRADAMGAIARLRQSVVALIDGEMVFPADGEYLLERLARVRDHLARGNVSAALPEMERFTERVRSLEEGNVLEAVDARPRLEAARALHGALATLAAVPPASGASG